MDREQHGGWVNIMSNRYRCTLYFGVTSDLAARIHQHRTGRSSEFCAREKLSRLVWAGLIEPIDAAIAHEKRLKRWPRERKFALIEEANPEWRDRFDELAGS